MLRLAKDSGRYSGALEFCRWDSGHYSMTPRRSEAATTLRFFVISALFPRSFFLFSCFPD